MNFSCTRVYRMSMKRPYGTLEVIAGPMFSGKTEELIRLVKRASIGKKHIQAFCHEIDTHYGKGKKLFSHGGIAVMAESAGSAAELLRNVKKRTQIVVIDEAQWFGPEVIDVVNQLLARGIKVIIAGLALTYDGQPFEPIPALMAMADRVMKLSAICSICGEDAVFHKRITNGTTADPLTPDPSLVSPPDVTAYEARCRKCYSK